MRHADHNAPRAEACQAGFLLGAPGFCDIAALVVLFDTAAISNHPLLAFFDDGWRLQAPFAFGGITLAEATCKVKVNENQIYYASRWLLSDLV